MANILFASWIFTAYCFETKGVWVLSALIFSLVLLHPVYMLRMLLR